MKRFGIPTVLTAMTLLVASALTGCKGKTDDMSNESDAMAMEEAAPNTLTQAEKDAGWKLLFDGTTTNGWKGYDKDTFPTKGWHIEDGVLYVEASNTEEAGFGGDIVTTQSYDNFELSLDFMLSDTANSGILYRVIETEDPIWHNAPEYQLLDDPTYIAMGGMNMTTHLTGDNYDMQSAMARPLKPVGEWNTARIIVNGAHVEHWLNGEKMLEYELWSPEWEAQYNASKFKDYPAYGRTQRGPIGLQDHGHRVSFRNIKIRPIA